MIFLKFNFKKNNTGRRGMEVESRERMKKIHAKPINIWEDFFKDKTHGGHNTYYPVSNNSN